MTGAKAQLLGRCIVAGPSVCHGRPAFRGTRTWSGHNAGTEAQPAPALTAVRLLVSTLPALLLVAACGVAWFYPLTRLRRGQISREPAWRRGRP